MGAKPLKPLKDLTSYALKLEFDKLIQKARRAGFVVIADSDLMAIRIIPEDEAQDDNLGTKGDVVRVHGGCGSASGGSGAGI